MKKLFFFWTVVFGCLLSNACTKNFLDKAPGVDLTEDNAFLNKASLETFMTTIYRYSVHSYFRYRNQGDLPFSQVLRQQNDHSLERGETVERWQWNHHRCQ